MTAAMVDSSMHQEQNRVPNTPSALRKLIYSDYDQRMSGGPGNTRGSPGSPGSPSFRDGGDRFIPRRGEGVRDLSNYNHLSTEPQSQLLDADTSPAKQDYRNTLRDTILPPQDGDEHVLALRQPLSHLTASPSSNGSRSLSSPMSPSSRLCASSPSSPSSPTAASPKKRRPARFIPKSPDKILDAPDLVDDYYLNLLDWSPSNILAVALSQSVFLWNASTGATHKLLETTGAGNIITSLSWGNGNTLAVGTHSAEIQLWDVAANVELRRMGGHLSRVASLGWGSNSLLSSGSRDSMIINHDTRAQQHKLAVLEGHLQEVCGLQWSPQGGQLASGGNDNLLNLWEARVNRSPRLSIERHCAAVKALAWCPFLHNVLASGGGTADRKICLWNTGNGTCLNEVDTKSQVCAIQWSVHDREFVSSHGFTHNQLILWRYLGEGRVQKITELTGHQARVLHMAKSPDGTTVVSAAADETLRFWRIFGSPTRSAAKLKDEQACRSLLGTSCIR
uniref:CDC20/Fizzy WD40 domain-containing protein n=1 Tax=Hemiselmis andersenii TaxID=464988 RepID=A0A7S1EJ41_HEMAN|mmetsp:Transcript_50053/g.121529  ORF Transcript_50053/g.121529 Transcript_50053/m.121529 type:complete len:506 (+) Transcript_50053:93-1610(+)